MRISAENLPLFVCTTLHHNPWTEITGLAFDLRTAKSHLIRLFKKEYGVTPGYYGRRIIMGIAASKLLLTNMVTEDIGLETHFSRATSFSTAFTVWFGVPPATYRRQRMWR